MIFMREEAGERESEKVVEMIQLLALKIEGGGAVSQGMPAVSRS